MNHFQPDQTMLHNYIQNKLSAEHTEAVELWLVDHPEAMQDMQLDLMFSQGLEEMHADNPNERSQWFHLPGTSVLNRMALAAAMAMVFVLGGLTVHWLEKDSGQSFNNPDIIMLTTNRGAETDARFNRNKNTVIQIPAGYLSDDRYTVELLYQSQTIHQIDDLAAKDDLLTMFVPKNLLVAGNYQLKVTNLNTQDSETFDLAVR